MSIDKNTYFDRFTDEVLPKYLAKEITSDECENLKVNKGLNGSEDNCSVFSSDLIPMLAQEVENILNGDKNIYANEDSKCSDEDNNATHASMWSRILRFSQAMSCILCAYDPILIKLLKSGTYPQVLMGNSSGKYPQWKTPDSSPTEGSNLPITSGAVYDAIQQALLQVWHIWTDHDEFSYYVDSYTELSDLEDAEDGDTAIVKNGEDGINQLYEFDGSWQPGDVLGVNTPANFSITKILKGYYAGKELYYMKDSSGNPTWNVLDASLTELEDRVSTLETNYKNSVLSASQSDKYLFGVADTLSEAMAVTPTPGKTTITLVIGD